MAGRPQKRPCGKFPSHSFKVKNKMFVFFNVLWEIGKSKVNYLPSLTVKGKAVVDDNYCML